MPLKILCAGCSTDERAVIESGVRAGLGERSGREAWTVSVVKFGSGWSVTLDGPFDRTRGLSFMLAGTGSPEGLAEALRSAANPPGEAKTAPPPAGPITSTSMAAASMRVKDGRGPHSCIVCGRQYVLIYDSEPGEPLEEAPVACPHCWQIDRVQVARSVSFGQDYRAEKV